MCGIGGIVGGGPPDPAVLERMAAAMAHRGPDAQGTWHDERCGLAFRRLALINGDLTAAERSVEDVATVKAMMPENSYALVSSIQAHLVAARLYGESGQEEKRQALVNVCLEASYVKTS